VGKLKEWAADDATTIEALRRDNEKLRKRLRFSGGLSGVIQSAVEAVYQENVRLKIPKAPKKGVKKDVEAALLHVTDLQWGKITKTYSSEIAAGRLKELGHKVATCIDRHRSYATVDELHLYLGGDLVEGENIFGGQSFLIDHGVFEQAVRSAPEAIAELIVFLLGVVRKVKVVGVVGNHGRVTDKHKGSHPLTNWDRVCMDVTRLMVEGPKGLRKDDLKGRLVWDLPDDRHAIDSILGNGNLLIHGDDIIGNFGGRPFEARLLKWTQVIPEPWKRIYFGHYHRYTSGEIAGLDWYCGGSLESDNDFALYKMSERGSPRQRLQFFTREHGVVADRPMYLSYGLVV